MSGDLGQVPRHPSHCFFAKWGVNPHARPDLGWVTKGGGRERRKHPAGQETPPKVPKLAEERDPCDRSFLHYRPDPREPPQRGGRLGRGRGGAGAGREGVGARGPGALGECVPRRLPLPRAAPGPRAPPPTAGPAAPVQTRLPVAGRI